jgi:hypothetical protein
MRQRFRRFPWGRAARWSSCRRRPKRRLVSRSRLASDRGRSATGRLPADGWLSFALRAPLGMPIPGPSPERRATRSSHLGRYLTAPHGGAPLDPRKEDSRSSPDPPAHCLACPSSPCVRSRTNVGESASSHQHRRLRRLGKRPSQADARIGSRQTGTRQRTGGLCHPQGSLSSVVRSAQGTQPMKWSTMFLATTLLNVPRLGEFLLWARRPRITQFEMGAKGN